MSSISLVIKTNDDVADFKLANHTNISRIVSIISAIQSGTKPGSLSLQKHASDPVAASGSVAITYGSLAANDTLVIGGVTLTCKASGAAADTEFNKETNATVTGDNLAAAINANTTLSPHVIASNASGTVTVTARTKGLIGNLIVMSKTGTGLTLTQLSGGTGGPAGAVAFFAR